MTVGTPCVEREQRSQYAESKESKREPNALLFEWNVMQSGYLKDVHRGGSRAEIDAEYADQQQCRTSHQHQCQFHGGIFFLAAAPYAD